MKIVVILPYYPDLRFTHIYDIILGLLCEGYKIEIIALRKNNSFEHSYFANKCKIVYLENIREFLTILDWIIGSIYLFIRYAFLHRFLLNIEFLRNSLAILKYLRLQKSREKLFIFPAHNVLCAIYGTILKHRNLRNKMLFGIFDYFAGMFEVSIPEVNLHFKVWLPKSLIKLALTNTDSYLAPTKELYFQIISLYKKLNLSCTFSFSICKQIISFTPIMPKKVSNNFTIVMVGGLEKYKGIKEAIEELQDVFIQNPNCKMLIIGNGPQKSELEEYIRAKNLTSVIKILGECDRIKTLEFIKSADILLHNSYFETGPTSLVEALVCNTIPVIRNIGFAREIIKNGYNGFIIDDKNNPLKKIIQDILSSPQKLEMMQKNIPLEFKNNIHFVKVIRTLKLFIEFTILEQKNFSLLR